MEASIILDFFKNRYSIYYYIDTDPSYKDNEEGQLRIRSENHDPKVTINISTSTSTSRLWTLILHEIAHLLDVRVSGYEKACAEYTLNEYKVEAKAWRNTKRLAKVFGVELDQAAADEWLESYKKAA